MQNDRTCDSCCVWCGSGCKRTRKEIFEYLSNIDRKATVKEETSMSAKSINVLQDGNKVVHTFSSNHRQTLNESLRPW